MTDTIDNTKLLHVIERLEALNDEIADLTNDKKTIMAEAKSDGFNPKAILHVLKLRKQGQAARVEEQNLFATYEAALGL